MLSKEKQRKTVSLSRRNKRIAELETEVITPELISQLRDGDQGAFKTLYLHYYGSVENFLFALLRSREEAEEMAQDVFMMLWEKRERLNPSNNIKSFIYTIARNAAMNLFDRRKVLDRYSRSMESVTFNDETTSEDILIAQETELLIKIAVARMPKMRRQIFEMSRYRNMDNAAIAAELGISKTNVANHLTLARKDIKEILTLFIFFMLP